MSQNTNQLKALLQVWEVLLFYRWRFILTVFTTMVLVLIGSLMIPRKYRADALFERRTDMVLNEIMRHGDTSDPHVSLVEEVAGQPAVDEMLEQVLPKIRGPHTEKDEITRQNLRNSLGRKVVVNYDIASALLDRVRVSYTGLDPKQARLIVNKLVENYLRRKRIEIDERLNKSAKFFQDEVDRHRSMIEDLENETLSFEIKHADLLPDSPSSVLTLQKEAQSQLALAQQDREATRLRLEALHEQLGNTTVTQPSTVSSKNPELDRLETKLRSLTDRVARYVDEFKMKDRHPDLVSARDQIDRLEKRIAATANQVVTERHTSANPTYAELQLQLTKTRAEHDALGTQCKTLKGRIDLLNDQSGNLFPVRAEYNKLVRKVGQAQRQVTFWEDNLRRVKLALTAETGDRGTRLDFIRPCGVIRKPVSPDFSQVILIAIAMGFAVGSTIVYFTYRTDESFNDGEQAAETLGLALFGSVSEIITRHQRRMRRLRNMMLYPVNAAAMAAVLIGVTTVLYLSLEKPYLLDESADTDAPAAAASPPTVEPEPVEPE